MSRNYKCHNPEGVYFVSVEVTTYALNQAGLLL
jgi:hypothetical protein